MPIYEYDCSECRRRVSVLILAPSTAPPPRCPRCGSGSLRRLMSRFTTVRSEEDRLESLADPASLGDLDENDPRSVARLMKKMGDEFGDELGDDFDAAVDDAVAESAAEEAGEASPGEDAADL